MSKIISKQTVKRRLQEQTMRVSVEFFAELNKKVENLIEDSIARAKSNGRTTVMARDL